jgi:hypothetical protein
MYTLSTDPLDEWLEDAKARIVTGAQREYESELPCRICVDKEWSLQP